MKLSLIVLLTSFFSCGSFSPNEALKVIRLPLLIYEYNKKINYTSIREYNENKNKNPVVILNQIASYAPNGKVIYFINDHKTGLQTGITISRRQKRISVVFRGTDSKLDWYYNFNFRQKLLYKNVRVHEGFYRQLHSNGSYQLLVDVVKEQLEKYPNYEIIVSGHSLGGALSTLFGFELSKEIQNKITIYSFASPRVGNLNFKKKFTERKNLKHFRVTYKRDIVPSFPMLNYHHVGTHIKLVQDNFKTLTNQYLLMNTLFYASKIKHHDLQLYYHHLKNITTNSLTQ